MIITNPKKYSGALVRWYAGNKLINIKESGFSLIELVVSIGVVAVLVVAMVNILLDSYKSSNKSRVIEKVEEEGSLVIKEIRRNLLEADPDSIVCTGTGSNSITFSSRRDGNQTTLSCNGTQIASASAAQTIILNGGNVIASGDCNSFVVCNNPGSSPLVEVKFSLSTEGTHDSINTSRRDFETKVMVRN